MDLKKFTSIQVIKVTGKSLFKKKKKKIVYREMSAAILKFKKKKICLDSIRIPRGESFAIIDFIETSGKETKRKFIVEKRENEKCLKMGNVKENRPVQGWNHLLADLCCQGDVISDFSIHVLE